MGAVFAQQPPQLRGTWRFERIEISDTSIRIPAEVAAIWEREKHHMTLELMPAAFKSTLSRLAESGAPTLGTWRQSEDGNTLFLKPEDSTEELAYTITAFTQQQLNLMWGQQGITMVLVRVAQ